MKLNMDLQNNELRGMKGGLAGSEELTEKISQLEGLATEKGAADQYVSANGSF